MRKSQTQVPDGSGLPENAGIYLPPSMIEEVTEHARARGFTLIGFAKEMFLRELSKEAAKKEAA